MSVAVANIAFDALSHRYTVDGAEYPSVTTILKAVGLIDDRFYTDRSREIGDITHACCELDDRGQLDDSTVDDAVWPRLKAWRAFKAMTQFEPDPEWIERPVCNRLMRYAGKLDNVGFIACERFLIDRKPEASAPWHRFQLCAYAACLPFHVRRAAVHLGDDGRYRFRTYDERRDASVWQACVTLFHARKEMGLL